MTWSMSFSALATNMAAAEATPPQPGEASSQSCAPSILCCFLTDIGGCQAAGSGPEYSGCPNPTLLPIIGLPHGIHGQPQHLQAFLKKYPLDGTVAPEMPTQACRCGLSHFGESENAPGGGLKVICALQVGSTLLCCWGRSWFFPLGFLLAVGIRLSPHLRVLSLHFLAKGTPFSLHSCGWRCVWVFWVES